MPENEPNMHEQLIVIVFHIKKISETAFKLF